MLAVQLESINDHHAQRPTHLGMIDLQPQNVGLFETGSMLTQAGTGEATISLTFQQLLRYLEHNQHSSLPCQQGRNDLIYVEDVIAFKFSTGWAVGQVHCVASSSDRQIGCTDRKSTRLNSSH